MIPLAEAQKYLIEQGVFVFKSTYGKKGVTDTKTMRIKNQVKTLADFTEFSNYNIYTGINEIVDVDIDCSEGLLLADYFLPKTGLEFGRATTPRSHRGYKVLDLTKKHTREFFQFGEDKPMLIEIRGHDHYTMCMGQYDEGNKVVWTKCEAPAEVTYDVLKKQCALLSLASVSLRRYPKEGMRNEYVKLLIAAMWYHKIDEADCHKIIEAIAIKSGDAEVNSRLKRVHDIYKRETNSALQGLPTLKEQFQWTDKEIKEAKQIMYAVTGRSEMPEFTHDFVTYIAYMMKQKMYYDLQDKEMYDGEAIDVKYAKFFAKSKYTPLSFWKKHPDSKVCVDFAYQPASEERFIKVNKKLMINVYEKNEITPDPKADTDLFDALIKHIIPHEEHREHFLDWYSYPIQNPGKKIRHAVILQSDEFQLGKGSLFDMHRDLLGHHNTNKIDLEQAINREKGFLVNKQTVLIDEAKAKGSWGEKSMFINTLKTLITEGSAGVRALYKGYTEQDTCTNYWINTNYRDAFPLPHNEVRYWVYFSEAKRNANLLTDFHNARAEGSLVRGVLANLMNRKIKFNPLGIAPATPYLELMHSLADKPVNDYIMSCFKQGVYPFDRSLITTTELFHWLKNECRAVRVTRELEIADALKNIGGIRKRNCPVHRVGSSVNIWIIRNHDEYKNLTAAELGRKYVGFYTDKRTTIESMKTPDAPTTKVDEREEGKKDRYNDEQENYGR
tara:strand:- start:808 stop:2985 length:2178 start_codon:yes stop_codon:yes gene_type:complete